MLCLGEPRAGHPAVEGKARHRVAVPADAALHLVAVSVVVLQIEFQILQAHGVVLAVPKLEPGVGGVDLQRLHIDVLAVQLQPAADLVYSAAGGVRRVEADVKGELRSRRFGVRGPPGLSHGGQALEGIGPEGDGHVVGHLIFVVEVDDIPAQLAVFLLLALRDHREFPAAHVDVVVEHGVGLRFVVVLYGDEQVHLLLIHDDVFRRHGDAVFRLSLADDLHVVVFHRPAQAPRPVHRRRQIAQHRDAGAGQREGGHRVHQQHKCGEHPRKAPQRQAPAPRPAAALRPGPRPCHSVFQLRRGVVQLPVQRFKFFHPVHVSASSPSSSRSRASARRWRPAAVP